VGCVLAMIGDSFAVVLIECSGDVALIHTPAASAAIVKFSDVQPSQPRRNDTSACARCPTGAAVEPIERSANVGIGAEPLLDVGRGSALVSGAGVLRGRRVPRGRCPALGLIGWLRGPRIRPGTG
jgi:hypothetical protein